MCVVARTVVTGVTVVTGAADATTTIGVEAVATAVTAVTAVIAATAVTAVVVTKIVTTATGMKFVVAQPVGKMTPHSALPVSRIRTSNGSTPRWLKKANANQKTKLRRGPGTCHSRRRQCP